MAVTMADITHLRKMTGAGMMDCKKALTESDGDFDKAMEIIRKKGQAVAAKREDREATEGCVLAAKSGDIAAIVALKCETDFVAKNEDFIALTQKILDGALAAKLDNIEAVKALTIDGKTVNDLIVERIGVTGEKMELGFYETVTAPSTVVYMHPGNKLAAIVGFNLPEVNQQVAREVAMQVAAMSPISVSRDQVPAEVIEKELEIAREKAREEGKKEEMLDKIAQGRINKFFQESTLLEQAFVKDAKKSIKQYLQETDKDLTVTTFKRVTLNVE